MSVLDEDVAQLGRNVETLTKAVNAAITTLQTIANESADDVIVKAANKAITDLAAKLSAATPK